MHIERVATERFELRFLDWERTLLRSLVDQTRDLLMADNSPLLTRLYPPAHVDDADAQEAYQRLAHDQLLESRLAALEVIEDSLGEGDGATSLDEAAFMVWMQAVNSVRLTLGTRLDVSEDDDPAAIDEDDPDWNLWMIYDALSSILGWAVHAMQHEPGAGG